MNIIKATLAHKQEVANLLSAEKLPTFDLPDTFEGFWIALVDVQLAGVIGMEQHGQHALLRSLAVHPTHRSRQIAWKLVETIEQTASNSGINSIYLITETAELFFEREGYQRTERSLVPPELLNASEFSHVCPISATVMKKQLLSTAEKSSF